MKWEAPFGGSADGEGVVPGPVREGLSPPRRAPRVTAGCEARGRSRSGSRSIRGRRVSRVWDVAATTAAVTELAEDLVELGVERVTVESTSDYVRHEGA